MAPPRINHMIQADIVGKIFAKHKVLKPILQYGLGATFEGVHVSLGKSCVIRMIPDEMKRDRAAVERFRTIISKCSQVVGPSLPTIQDVIYEPPAIGYVLPHTSGMTLAHRVGSQGKLPFSEFSKIFSAVVRALQSLHKAGVTHHALRPESIMLGNDGSLQLIDAGILWDVRSSKGESSLAVAHYTAPEGAIRGALDPRSDLYSLGATMYFALTGKPPYPETDPVAAISAHVGRPLTPPSQHRQDIPASFNSLILRLLDKDPEKRGDLPSTLSFLDPHSLAAPARKPVPKKASTLKPPSETEPPPSKPKTMWYVIGGGAGGRTG